MYGVGERRKRVRLNISKIQSESYSQPSTGVPVNEKVRLNISKIQSESYSQQHGEDYHQGKRKAQYFKDTI